MSAFFDALVGHGGGIQHLGHDAGVDHGGAGADLQTVQLGDLVGRCGRQAHFTADLHHPVLVLRVVHAEGLSGNKGLCPLLLQLLDSRADAAVQIRCIGVHIFVAAAQVLALRQLDVPHGGIALALCAPQAAAQRDDADGATSPSSRAFVACVVPWAMKMTSSGRISHCSMTLCSTCTMPAATPSAAVWVVGTFTLPTTSKVSLSMATASVKVPPTSIPIRTFIKSKNLLFFLFFFAAFRARADPDIRMGGPSISRRWNDKRAGYSDRPCSGLRTARCRRLVGEKTTQK